MVLSDQLHVDLRAKIQEASRNFKPDAAGHAGRDARLGHRGAPFSAEVPQGDAPDNNYAVLKSICGLTPHWMDSLGGGRYG